MSDRSYRIVVEPLSEEDGGGWLTTVPDLPDCMSDGETPPEAVQNVLGAIDEWIDAAKQLGRPIPEPTREQARA